ncbi:C40 family peptidase [Prochlorococcus sp. AH-716-K03]|nr:C40 family peptidase [Prochlorococcus sp. AH-716-K03]
MKEHIDPLSLFKQTNFSNTIWWKVKINISGYQNESKTNLVTEILKNRIFRLIYPNFYQSKKILSRILVQFYEDGYICWIDLQNLSIEKFNSKNSFVEIDEASIQKKIPLILNWIKDKSKLKNQYLWGGTLGPNFDCSGLIQTAFLHHEIYIPRDSYQIKSFCRHLFNFKENNKSIKKGDILFFGNNNKCDHVGIYKGDGLYYHSSGKDYGRNGIGVDTLKNTKDKISLHYQSKLISAGRINRSYRWNKSIR